MAITATVTNGFSTNINDILSNSAVPNFDFQIPIGGIIGELLKMSGPYILQKVFTEVANSIVSKVFIGIIGLDEISFTQSEFENLIQSLTGFSIDQLQTMFDIDLNEAFNNPSIVSNLVTTTVSKINLSAFDYSNSNSLINNIGLGTPTKATLNIGESLDHSLITLMGISTNIPNDTREKLKNALEFGFVLYMVSDILSQVIDIAKSRVGNGDPYQFPYTS